jgi:hypothetical protein
MRFRLMYALVAALSACVVLFGAASIATGAPGNGNGGGDATATANANGGGSGSTAESGPGNSAQGCDGTHNSDTGHGANQGGPYDNTCDGSPSGNGNGNGRATGKPCAGCVGNADDKNPGFGNGKGQMPNGSDHNAGYECDRNHGIGRTNPAHTGCASSSTVTPPPPPPKTCPNGQPLPPSGNCGNGENGETPPPPKKTTSPPPPPSQQAVLGERQSSPEAATAPSSTPNQKVLGARTGAKKPAAKSPSTTSAPVTARRARAATAPRTLPFTGTDLTAVLLAGALLLLAGAGLRRLAADRS